MKKKILNAVFFAFLLVGMLTGLGSDCDGGGSTGPPSAVNGSFTTATFPYLCNDGSPAFLVENGPNGGGKLIVDVTGTTLPAFKDRRVNTLISNTIDCGSNPTCCVSHTFPATGGFTISLWYNELGNSGCPPPTGSNMCWRWFKQETFADGFTPACSDVITINIQDPTGFSGPCG